MIQAVVSQLAGVPCLGFSGSRRPSALSLAALRSLVELLPSGVSVVTGCAPGIDQAARLAFPGAQVFRAAAFGVGRGAFAARSVACVRAVAAAGGLWVSFPAGACPDGLRPSSQSSRCFCGTGSGTWASLAFAVGLGLPCLVFLPPGVLPPRGWGLQPLGGGWFHIAPPEVQGSLF